MNQIVDPLDSLISVFNRATKVDALGELLSALEPQENQIGLSQTAIGVDANVFLRLADHSKSALIIDYLSGQHGAPLILPGQAVQEFWNNQTEAVHSVARKLRSSFDSFKKNLDQIEDDFGEHIAKIEELVDTFESEHGSVYEASTVSKTRAMLENFSAKASVPFCPRSNIERFANHRHNTKTPPGFKDSGDGDFFIWADFLYGLKSLQTEGVDFERAVLVTNDKKIDWSRDGIAHPILAAEVRALLDVSFETWTLQQLISAIEAE